MKVKGMKWVETKKEMVRNRLKVSNPKDDYQTFQAVIWRLIFMKS
jgi:hypothetical protein